ncbi:carboxylesterase/lipase family protein [Pseudonocardia abyssalis]|uniref:Carboxylic ester hydrolase n=2 Tax=Pseudonocardia abyssalis TaxID=2792008 RepID=A0ABS6UQ64_9PSEU|nr:carboxylesterase family protein [Pseudonocardia abyssalis]MBW0134401.1 carboxylesterase family protein [Pseudonocardia abyssalis]
MHLRAIACALLGALVVSACGAGPPVGETVRVEQGELRGRTDGDVLRFGDVPYAAPAQRWVAPAPPAAWDGVRDATGPGSRCPQTAAAPDVPHATAASVDEDCLTLDVTVPTGTPADARLPVLVWLHGGGFSAGAGADYDPRRLARAGLVVVTVNYRLGMLGFLALPGLAGSGTFGLADQQAALGWVARNAAVFGGDPAQVTLAGESAGADGVCAQLAAPAAAGLFARAVMQSGGCGTANLLDVIGPGTGPAGDTWKLLDVAEELGTDTAEALGCGGRRPLECLRTRPVEQLVGAPGYWSPATGTPLLPRRPSDVLTTMPPVPILAGTTRDEGTLFTNAFLPTLDPSTFRTLLARAGGDRARDVGRTYSPGDRTPSRVWAAVVTDRAYACPALDTYAALAGRGPVFAYEFADITAPSPFAALAPDLADGVTHGAEVPYLFDLRPGVTLTAAQGGTAAELVTAWARFARSGDPGWPAWTGGGTVRTITAGAPADHPAGDIAAEHHCGIWR